MWGLFTSGQVVGLTFPPRQPFLIIAMAPERSFPSSSTKGIPCPVIERGVSRIRSGTLKHFGRGVVEESPAHCAKHVILWETSPEARCLLLPEALSSGRSRPWTPSLLVTLPSLRDASGGVEGGVGEDRALEMTHCTQLVPGGVCPRPGTHVSSGPPVPTVLQHPGEQHHQSVCPSDHRQVSLDSALASACPLVVPRFLSSFQPRVFYVLAQTGAQGPHEGWEWPGELRVGEGGGGWEGRKRDILRESRDWQTWALQVTLCKYSFPDVMMPSYSQNPWSCIFFIVYLSIELYFIMNLVSGLGLCSVDQPQLSLCWALWG